MTRRDKQGRQRGKDSGRDEGKPSPSSDAHDASEVRASGWSSDDAPLRYKAFPGPSGPANQLRVAITREAYADLTAHARASLDVEVCGVLVGEVYEDDYGPYVAVEATIEGTSAKHGAAHVTFTQETWTEIHKQLEERYPRLQIVGWYHTHPGFGVQFSDMDMFIQKNFFAGRHQIALVTDPLGGAEALCANTANGIEAIERFWVDGRERRCQTGSSSSEEVSYAQPVNDERLARALRDMEDRMAQLIRALDETRSMWYRAVMTVGMLVAVAVIVLVVYNVYDSVFARHQPPKEYEYAKAPVKIGDKWVMLGARVITWELPPEVEAAWVDHLIEEVAAREKAAREEAEKEQARDAARKTEKSSGKPDETKPIPDRPQRKPSP